ncbi:MAG: SapC family protein [Xanthobacteraceae bacterium]
MATQLLIYKTAVPISTARHRDWSVEGGAGYAFSGEINSVPIMAVEFPAAASEYAIVFAGTEGEVMPAVILGLRDQENLYLSDEKSWQAKYVPAFVRRYPFVFIREGDRFVLSIDEEFPGFNREGRGERLFGEDGKHTAYVDGVLKFLQEYQAQFLRTQRFCRKIKELDLLEPMQAQVDLGPGRRVSLGGFTAISREKLKALPADKLAELAKTDELELLYLHLQSMRNFVGMKDRLESAMNRSSKNDKSANTDRSRKGADAKGAVEKEPEPDIVH